MQKILDGIRIPKGTHVAIQIMHLHHDPEVWQEPETFDPDRFLSENVQKRHPYAYIPFSAGPRNCIGQKFALLELKVALTTILRTWKVKSLLKPHEIKHVSQIVLRPKNSIDLFFIPKPNKIW